MCVFKGSHLYAESLSDIYPVHAGDLKPSAEVKITGPVGKEMLMPKDPNATIIMVIHLILSIHEYNNEIAIYLFNLQCNQLIFTMHMHDSCTR